MRSIVRSRLGISGICIVVLVLSGRTAPAAEKDAETESIRAAVNRSLPLLTRSAQISSEKKSQCFTCHNQGLPILAMTTAAARGFEIDRETLKIQIAFTAEFLENNRAKYLQGKGQGGQAHTAGYAMWTLENGGCKPDATTAAVTEYLLVFQKDLDHWKPQSDRPPSEGSHFATSYVALRALKQFGTPEQRDRIEKRVAQVRQWMVAAKPKDTEDRVFQLLALKLTNAAREQIATAAEALRKGQRSDGGWAQLESMKSDAYATGTALFALQQAGGLAVADPIYQKGLKFLLSTQLADGSWHVPTRSKPIQTYYESGYPHGKDQFASITAAGWATTALALAIPVQERVEVK
jgi:hypothetical protein